MARYRPFWGDVAVAVVGIGVVGVVVDVVAVVGVDVVGVVVAVVGVRVAAAGYCYGWW